MEPFPRQTMKQCQDTASQPTENLKCKSTQKRLATLWGYEKKEPDHLRGITKMVPVSQMLEALRTGYSDLIYESNQKMAVQFEEDIINMAREAGFVIGSIYAPVPCQSELERFASLIAEAEREACAKVCDARYMGDNNREDMEAKRCAESIRARS